MRVVFLASEHPESDAMQTILAPIDFSPVSRRVIDAAVVLAIAVHARVVLLNIVQPPVAVTDLAPLAGETVRFTADVERAARYHLNRLKNRLLKRGVSVASLCEQGYPVPLIVSQAKKLEARYIVIGSHGHTAFYNLVIGSTASGVLKDSPCPVVVVPAKPGAKLKRWRKPASQRAKVTRSRTKR